MDLRLSFITTVTTRKTDKKEKKDKKLTPEVSYVEVITILPFLSVCFLILCCVDGYPLICPAGLTVHCIRNET